MRGFGAQGGSSEVFVPELVYLRGRPVVVDVGGGRGGKAGWLAERGSYVVLVEPNPRYLEAAPRHPLVERVMGVAEHLPVRSGAARGVLAWNVLMWTHTPRALAEISRVAARGAPLVLSVYRVRSGARWARGRLPYSAIAEAVKRAGFRVAREQKSGVQYRVVAVKEREARSEEIPVPEELLA